MKYNFKLIKLKIIEFGCSQVKQESKKITLFKCIVQFKKYLVAYLVKQKVRCDEANPWPSQAQFYFPENIYTVPDKYQQPNFMKATST